MHERQACIYIFTLSLSHTHVHTHGKSYTNYVIWESFHIELNKVFLLSISSFGIAHFRNLPPPNLFFMFSNGTCTSGDGNCRNKLLIEQRKILFSYFSIFVSGMMVRQIDCRLALCNDSLRHNSTPCSRRYNVCSITGEHGERSVRGVRVRHSRR